MNKIKNLILVSFIVITVMNCKKNEKNPEVKTVAIETEASNKLDPNATYAKAEFTIDGMTCAMGCAATIEKKISKMDGVKSAKVDFDKKLAMVEYDVAKVTPNNLIETVAKVGDTYKVSNMKTVDGVSNTKMCDKACCANKTDAEKAACKMACCTETASNDTKATCGTSCKKECCNNNENKTSCAADSKKACCAEKSKV